MVISSYLAAHQSPSCSTPADGGGGDRPGLAGDGGGPEGDRRKKLVCEGSERVGRQLGQRGFELIPSFRVFVEATIKHHLLNESNQILTHPRSCLPALHVRVCRSFSDPLAFPPTRSRLPAGLVTMFWIFFFFGESCFGLLCIP